MPQLSFSTLLSSIFYLIPLYLFVFAPLLRTLSPQPTTNIFDPDDASIPLDPDTDISLDPEILSLPDGIIPSCPEDNYRVHLLSKEPLVIYIEDFLSTAEADHLLEMSSTNYTPSIIYNGVTTKIDPSTRLSDRALLPRDNTVRCLEARASAFQGWKPHLYIERMWAQRYNVSGHYAHHFDWAGSAARGGDRLSTFMVYLDDDCEGGGTNFPRLRMPRGAAGGGEWCRFLECADITTTTATNSSMKTGDQNVIGDGAPVKGNAIFWENLRADGSGYPETWHASFPVTRGLKVGLNIWSWYQPPRRR
ncbi:oxidoreductase [Aspergillus heteromorphus CBS 117.55]|uniref:Oxidoreductase n=1 Tax=Aspergillus heteromorphus CBS 117.55 TaxID=1448321 RepID=A0A317X122_9EURO|nr:oxidoreductase [Aspergillus heteromorphus CBS 117.55]PWY92344.1 oxidoreductase [Aspergillus heteromorphus CBS 117.55]